MGESDSPSSGGMPMMNPFFGGGPMMGGNPMFGGPSPMGGGFGGPSPMSSDFGREPDDDKDLDVDDLVKKIDAKIAELEEEERKENEKKQNADNKSEPVVIEGEAKEVSKPEQSNNVPLNELNDNGQKLYDDDTDNDKFFDDFFSDQ